MSRPVVILFTRVPRLGVGKRRLACTIGERAALKFARTTLATMLHRLRSVRGITRVIAVTPDRAAMKPPAGFTAIPQGTGDLGVRMQRAFRQFPNRPVMLIGSDIPAIMPADIRTARRLLGGADAVFGPAADGGYWLIGMAGKRPASAFTSVRWSSPHALVDTKHNFPRRRIAHLRMLRDLDE